MYNICRLYLFLITFLLTLSWFLPMNPAVIGEGLDPSWKVTLNYAFLEKLSFGQNVIFTYGPLSFLNTNMFHPSLYGFVFVYQVLVALVFAAISVAILNVKRNMFVKSLLYIAMIIIAIQSSAVVDNLNLALPVLLVIVVGIQKLTQNNRTFLNAIVVLLLILLALTLLAKGSSLLIVIPVLLMLDITRILERRLPIYIASIALIFSIIWIVVGQPISGLIPYFTTLFELIRGYSEMAINGPTKNIYAILLCAVCLAIGFAILIFTQYKRVVETKDAKSEVTVVYLVVALLSVALVVFLSFKSGFVRHDGHETLAFFGIFIAALLVVIIYFAFLKLRLVTLIPILLSVSVCTFFYGQYMQESFYKNRNYALLSAQHAFYTKPIESFNFVKRAGAARAAPEPFLVSLLGEAYDLEKKYTGLSEKVRLPDYLQDKTVDIFPWDQAVIIAKHLNFRPRPVIQSYSVYTNSLVRRNIDYYLSTDAPEYVVFSVKTIDDRYPSIDDGALWPIIWRRYEAVDLVDGFLILKRRLDENIVKNNWGEVESYNLDLGKALDINSNNNDLLWLKGEVSKNWWGKIVGILFKVPIFRVVINFDDGSSQTHRILASTFESGFLLSPYVSTASEFALSQISGTPTLKNVQSIQFVDSPAIRRFYHHNVKLTIENLDQADEFITDELKQQIRDYALFVQLVNSDAFTVATGKQWTRDWLVGRNVLNAHANSQAQLDIEKYKLSSQHEYHNKLNVEYGIAEGAYSGDAKTNGVIFNVIGVKDDAEQTILFSDTLDPLNNVLDRGVQKQVIDLELENYQNIIFETLMNNDSSWDWSYWSNISLR